MAVLCFFFFAGDRLEDKVQLPDHGIRALPYQPFGEVARCRFDTEISRNAAGTLLGRGRQTAWAAGASSSSRIPQRVAV
jgi:hypothetical protein